MSDTLQFVVSPAEETTYFGIESAASHDKLKCIGH